MLYKRLETGRFCWSRTSNEAMNINRQNMTNLVMRVTERYLNLLYDRLHGILFEAHTLQADETTVEVTKDGRSAGSKSYM